MAYHPKGMSGSLAVVLKVSFTATGQIGDEMTSRLRYWLLATAACLAIHFWDLRATWGIGPGEFWSW